MCQQEQFVNSREGYISSAAVHKPLITMIDVHLRVAQNPEALGYTDVERSDTISGAILLHILDKWPCVACTGQESSTRLNAGDGAMFLVWFGLELFSVTTCILSVFIVLCKAGEPNLSIAKALWVAPIAFKKRFRC